MANFTADGREQKFVGDPQRSYMWQVTFPNIGNMIDKSLSSDIVEELTVRARTAAIPARGLEMIETNWMAMKQYFPGKPSMNNTLSIQFMESQTTNLYAILNSILQTTFSYKSGHSKIGLQKRPTNTALSYAQDIHLGLLKFDGTPASDKIFIFKNAVLSNVDDASLAYTDNNAVMFGATFTFDLMFYAKIGEPLIEL